MTNTLVARGPEKRIRTVDRSARYHSSVRRLRDDSETVAVRKLRVWFDAPRSGWLPATVATGDCEAVLSISDVPNDFVFELVTALLVVAQGSGFAFAVANEEPRRIAFEFNRADRIANFAAVDHRAAETMVSFNGRPADVVLPFWRALRRLQTANATEWRWAFPDADIARLSAAVEGLKSAG